MVGVVRPPAGPREPLPHQDPCDRQVHTDQQISGDQAMWDGVFKLSDCFFLRSGYVLTKAAGFDVRAPEFKSGLGLG